MLHAIALAAAILGQPTPDRPTAVCSAAAPAAGATISGPVLQVIDGRTLCVAQGPVPSRWVKVSLVEPAADRASLQSALFARKVVCTVQGQAGDAVLARCALAETPLDVQPAVLAAPAPADEAICRTTD